MDTQTHPEVGGTQTHPEVEGTQTQPEVGGTQRHQGVGTRVKLPGMKQGHPEGGALDPM